MFAEIVLPSWLLPVGGIIFVVGVATAILIALKKSMDALAKWIPFSGEGVPEGMTYYPADESVKVDVKRLTEVVVKAVECLDALGPWEKGFVMHELRGVGIKVNAVERWPTEAGQNVWGQAVPMVSVVIVGPRFLALAHEFAHVLEFRAKTGYVDMNHEKWRENGIYEACTQFETWLMKTEGP